jgi:hypothetical protein
MLTVAVLPACVTVTPAPVKTTAFVLAPFTVIGEPPAALAVPPPTVASNASAEKATSAYLERRRVTRPSFHVRLPNRRTYHRRGSSADPFAGCFFTTLSYSIPTHKIAPSRSSSSRPEN